MFFIGLSWLFAWFLVRVGVALNVAMFATGIVFVVIGYFVEGVPVLKRRQP